MPLSVRESEIVPSTSVEQKELSTCTATSSAINLADKTLKKQDLKVLSKLFVDLKEHLSKGTKVEAVRFKEANALLGVSLYNCFNYTCIILFIYCLNYHIILLILTCIRMYIFHDLYM